MILSRHWLSSASDDELQEEKRRMGIMSGTARDNDDMSALSAIEMAMDDVEDELYRRSGNSGKRGNCGECESCGLSLYGGDYHAPWEDGDNEYGYIKCPHCSHKNVRY